MVDDAPDDFERQEDLEGLLRFNTETIELVYQGAARRDVFAPVVLVLNVLDSTARAIAMLRNEEIEETRDARGEIMGPRSINDLIASCARKGIPPVVISAWSAPKIADVLRTYGQHQVADEVVRPSESAGHFHVLVIADGVAIVTSRPIPA
jgi:hypothetical protein